MPKYGVQGWGRGAGLALFFVASPGGALGIKSKRIVTWRVATGSERPGMRYFCLLVCTDTAAHTPDICDGVVPTPLSGD